MYGSGLWLLGFRVSGRLNNYKRVWGGGVLRSPYTCEALSPNLTRPSVHSPGSQTLIPVAQRTATGLGISLFFG